MTSFTLFLLFDSKLALNLGNSTKELSGGSVNSTQLLPNMPATEHKRYEIYEKFSKKFY